MKYKYRIIKRSDKPYYTLERRPTSRFKWFEDILKWEFVDLNDNLQYLENKSERMIREDNIIVPGFIVIKEYSDVD